MSALLPSADPKRAAIHWIADKDAEGVIPFSCGTLSEKIQQNQKRIIEMVPRGGIEPPTPAFSVQCSTN
jgi:hypothetical protein